MGEGMKKRYYSAVIFDVDGLLLDTERLMLEIWKKTSTEYGFNFPDDLYESMIGRTFRDSQDLLNDAFGPDFPVSEAYEKRTQYFLEYAHKNGLPQKIGVDEILDYLESINVPVCIATSASADIAALKIDRGGLSERFDKIVCGDDVSVGKPSPEIFIKAADLLQIPPEKCIVLEDSVAGIFAAKLANTIPIMVPDIVYPEPDVKKMALAVLHSLRMAKNFIENNMAYKSH